MSEMQPIRMSENIIQLDHLEETVGFLLRLAQLSAFESFFAVYGASGIRPGKSTVLIVIGINPGARQGAIAARLKIKRAQMAKIVKALVGEGLVKRTIPEDDRRSVELWLTEAGRKKITGFNAALEEVDRRITENMSGDEIKELLYLLKKLVGLSAPVFKGSS